MSMPFISTLPIPDHAAQDTGCAEAGKHVACPVPMATTIDEVPADRRTSAQDRQGLHVWRRVVYSREYLFVKEMYDKGELGRISSLRGSIHSRTWKAGPATGRLAAHPW